MDEEPAQLTVKQSPRESANKREYLTPDKLILLNKGISD